jgi:hypothetical protein
MLIDLSRLLLLTISALLRRGWVLFGRHFPLTAWVLRLPAALAELHCAHRMEVMVRRIEAMGLRIDSVHAALRSGHDCALIEGDVRFRRMLGVVRDDMCVLRGEAAAWQRDRHAAIASARLRAALASVAGASARIHGRADALLVELAERDRRRGAAAPS